MLHRHTAVFSSLANAFAPHAHAKVCILGAAERGVVRRADELNKPEDALPATPDSLAGMMGRKLGVDKVPLPDVTVLMCGLASASDLSNLWIKFTQATAQLVCVSMLDSNYIRLMGISENFAI